MAAKLSQRETLLAILVGGVLFLLLNLAVFRFVTSTRVRLQADIAAKHAEVETLESLFQERELWEQRSDWIAQYQPKLESRDSAGVQLLEEVKRIAQAHSVLLENPGLGNVEAGPERTSVPVNFETKCSWGSLISFLADLQSPERFVAVETINLKVDATDATQMRGRLRVAKWYAP